jgi:hypothetical protein
VVKAGAHTHTGGGLAPASDADATDVVEVLEAAPDLPYLPKRDGPLPVPLADGRPITDYSDSELVTLIRWIESDGLLRPRSDLHAEAIETLGYRRRGPRIVAAIDRAIGEARDEM